MVFELRPGQLALLLPSGLSPPPRLSSQLFSQLSVAPGGCFILSLFSGGVEGSRTGPHVVCTNAQVCRRGSEAGQGSYLVGFSPLHLSHFWDRPTVRRAQLLLNPECLQQGESPQLPLQFALTQVKLLLHWRLDERRPKRVVLSVRVSQLLHCS